ncbi:MAG: BLUF domain-containing protein, partial [Burkholderiaceae bacterium]
MTPLSTLVYRSKATIPLTELELLYLLGQARGRNQAEMITGLLVYDRGLFYQWIEGPDQSMGKLWQAIRQDPRHGDIEILSEQQIPIRLFRDWHMQLAFREGYWGSAIDGLVQAPNDVLDQLHE